MSYTVHPVSTAGTLLARRQATMFEIHYPDGRLALTCETRRSADRWAVTFNERAAVWR